jgi:molybdopterin-containing oxidoreductase family iron-sulfur binding subunit
MGINRREFLRIAGIASLWGLGGKTAFEILKPGALEAQTRAPLMKGKKWAMIIDTRKFKSPEDFQKCIEACDKTHNIPKVANIRQEIKWIWKEHYENAFPDDQNQFLPEEMEHKSFLVLCNHCTNPPCVRVCPTQATFKRADGIVMMDYHRCIGCRFCMAGCPYGSRSFNFRDPRRFLKEVTNQDYPTRSKGVVEKCNFCEERLAKGLVPACVEASKGGMIFGDLDNPNSEIRKLLKENYSIRRKPSLGTQPNVYYLV